ncbi:MAG: crossover junction endodeoxyribonuclease RuvC [candidate division Zixibacteria bacterium]|nr:crossover junction endodeoxyribonuclease RuvC [candidate division Zixibacteria bacterium]
MRILGIDPGLAATGYGFLDVTDEGVNCGTVGIIQTTTGAIADRLRTIFLEMKAILERERPQEVAVEEGFYSKNVKVALSLGQARGAVLLACSLAKVPIYEYSPREVKLSTVGNGAASKQQVNYMITSLLNLAEPPATDDISDALAVAYCHYLKRENRF